MAGVFGGLEEDTYDRQYSDGYLMGRITDYMARYKWRLIAIVLAFLAVAIVGALPPIFIAWGVDILEGEGDIDKLWLLVGALLVAAFIQYGSNWTRRLYLSVVVGHMVADLRKDAFSAAMERDLAFYDKHKSGKIVSRITSDTQEFGNVLMMTSDVIAMLIQVAFLLVVLFMHSLDLTLILLMIVPVMLITTLIFRWMARVVTRQGSRAMAAVNGMIQESVSGIAVAKNFRREALIYGEFQDVNNQSYRINLRRGFVMVTIFPVMTSMSSFAVATVLYIGADYVLQGVVNIGTWFLFIQAADRFWFPFMNLAALWSQFQQALSAIERVFALVDADNTIVQTGSASGADVRGKIELHNVSFGYEADQLILRNFNLKIAEGEDVAFVGHTGAGKTSVARLIARFYEFQGGEILVDGQDIRSFDLKSYRGRLGIVPQRPFLFSGTIRDNIRYSRSDASDEEINEVAYSVGNGEWLETLPDRLDTDVGERGARLSMGQRQLVSLMRVLLEKPAIFVLDEATASVDPFTEMQIQEALNLILSRSTSILIAHRLSTVRNADRIIVLKDGDIIEEGSHDNLMEQNGHYAELYNTYFRHQSLSYIENAREMFSER
jgi:ATP-binding cassette, subfamily B, bacterial